MRKFNTTGPCVPSEHYMVDLSERVTEIKEMVDDGKYFTINRARQYGKTTTLAALQRTLGDQYLVLSLSLGGVTAASYKTEGDFVRAFASLILDQREFFGLDIPDEVMRSLEGLRERAPRMVGLYDLFLELGRWNVRSDRGVVIMIDEVGKSANNQVFLDFLGLLRDSYNARATRGVPTFQSVILAGVTDVRHLKQKIRPEEDSDLNSP